MHSVLVASVLVVQLLHEVDGGANEVVAAALSSSLAFCRQSTIVLALAAARSCSRSFSSLLVVQLLHEVDGGDDEDGGERQHHHHRQAHRPILVVYVPHLR